MSIGVTRTSYRTEGIAIDTYSSRAGLLSEGNGVYGIGQVVALVDGVWEKYVAGTHDIGIDIDFTGETASITGGYKLGVMINEIDTTGETESVPGAAILVSGRVRRSDIVPAITDAIDSALMNSGIYAE